MCAFGGRPRSSKRALRLRSFRHVVECVGKRSAPASDPLVCQVGNGLRCSGEDWGAVLPAHRENEGERHELGIPRLCRKHDAKLGDVSHVQVDSVEAVAEVELEQLNRSEGGVCQDDLSEDSVESVTKLHCIKGGEGQSVLVHL